MNRVFDARWRATVERGTAPVGSALRRTGVTPNQLTGLGLVLAVVAAAVIASGHLVAGALLIGVCGLPDLLDGPVAKATGSASVRGAFFDSVADRVTDALLLAGVAWYLGTTSNDHLAVLPLAVLAASMLPSYIRAKAESLGLSARGGIMERAERMIALGIGLIVQPFFPLLVPVLWIVLGLSLLTAVQRFVSVWAQAPAAARRREAERRWRV
ncbi:MAG: CDP-alcohol phosphatidyltransferase family protein, partial [Acidimicrobiales bacterium]